MSLWILLNFFIIPFLLTEWVQKFGKGFPLMETKLAN